jgi:hypothetical protein
MSSGYATIEDGGADECKIHERGPWRGCEPEECFENEEDQADKANLYRQFRDGMTKVYYTVHQRRIISNSPDFKYIAYSSLMSE